MTRQPAFFLVAFLCSAGPLLATAQDRGHRDGERVCATDLTTPEAIQALANFQEARARGLLATARKTASPPEIGERRTFRVSEDSWIEVEFELVDKEDNLYYLWVSVFELDTGRITETVIQDLRTALVESTPGSIINPDAGVMANNESLLGPPPNYDGDGVTDVLMYDIDPNDSTPGSFIAGYVTGADINPHASSSTGNQADILYLDSNQGITSGATASTAAHEYAHLIHFATGFDTDTFISEGIAEYLTVVNGLGRSRYSFLTLASDTRLPFFNWRSGSSDVLRDYARAELFFRYVGEHFSPETVAEIAANPYKSSMGIDSVLSARGSSFAETLVDYHSANLVNDRRINDRFGYGPDVESSGVRAAIERTFSGTASSSLPELVAPDLPTLESGSVSYIALTNVADLRFQFDAVVAPILLPSARNLLGGRIFFQDELGAHSWADIYPREDEFVFPGNFLRARIVFANTKPGSTAVSKYEYSATWAPFGQATPNEPEVALPQSLALHQNYPNPFNPRTSIVFELPAATNVRLTIVDQLGRTVQKPADGHFSAGSHSIPVDGSRLASGTYLYVLTAGGERLTRLLTLVK
jgi:type IX secretion system substrate protein